MVYDSRINIMENYIYYNIDILSIKYCENYEYFVFIFSVIKIKNINKIKVIF